MRNLRTTALLLVLLATACIACISSTVSHPDSERVARASTARPKPTSTLAPSPEPTQTPAAMSELEPVVYTGAGEDVVQIQKPGPGPCFIVIESSPTASYFVVEAYNESGQELTRLVSTFDNYSGTQMLDAPRQYILPGEAEGETSMLHVKTETGQTWRIELQPLSTQYIQERAMGSPGRKSGIGDYVLTTNNSPLALRAAYHGDWVFQVIAHGDETLLVINEWGEYEGTTLLPRDTTVLEVRASPDSEWEIETVPRN